MKKYSGRTPQIAAAQQDELLLSQLRLDLRMRRVPEERTREQRAALARAEALLDAYVSYFYPPDAR